jgi:hypothetical protein
MSVCTAFTQRAKRALNRLISQVSQLTLHASHILLDCQAHCESRCGPNQGIGTGTSTLGDEHCLQGSHSALTTAQQSAVDAWSPLLLKLAGDVPQQQGSMLQSSATSPLMTQSSDHVLEVGAQQWIGTLGTYAATTCMWLWRHAPQVTHSAQRVCVHWVGASVGEVESIPVLEAILLHSLPECKVMVV